MKYLGLLLSIMLAWAVRLLAGWVGATFGTEIDPDTQTEVVNWLTAGAVASAVVVVEVFERVVWPPVRAKLKAWWAQKFPTTVAPK